MRYIIITIIALMCSSASAYQFPDYDLRPPRKRPCPGPKVIYVVPESYYYRPRRKERKRTYYPSPRIPANASRSRVTYSRDYITTRYVEPVTILNPFVEQ